MQQPTGSSSPIVVYFFIRLPEVLDVALGPHHFDVGSPIQGSGAVGSRLRSAPKGTGYVTLVCRQLQLPSGFSNEIDAVFDLMYSAVHWAFPDGQHFGLRRRITQKASTPSTIFDDVTVIEAAVSLPINYTVNHDPFTPDLALTDGLDDVLESINALQLLHYAITRRPSTRVSAETLPALIPFVLGRSDGSSVVPVEDSVRMFKNDLGEAAEEVRAVSSGSLVENYMTAAVPRGPFTKYLQLRLEAQALLQLGGDYRAALLLLAAASESMMDAVLMMLNWEKESSPEECVKMFSLTSSITRRVRDEFANVLGEAFQWNLAMDSPIGNWHKDIALLRNEVVHYGSRVPREEALKAWATAEDLRFFFANLLLSRSADFPLTTFTYFTGLLMEPSGGWSAQMTGWLDSVNKGNLWSFDRWVITLRLRTLDKFSRREPSWDGGGLVAVTKDGGNPDWVWHDWRAGQAQRVSVAPEIEEEFKLRNVSRIGWQGFAVEGSPIDARSEWKEEYHYIPGLGVHYLKDDLVAPFPD